MFDLSNKMSRYRVGDYVDIGYRMARGYYNNPEFRARILALRPADNKPIGMHQVRYWDEVEVEVTIPSVTRMRAMVAELGKPHTKECPDFGQCDCFKEREVEE